MEVNTLTVGEFNRLDKLSPSSSLTEFDWVKARTRALSSEVKRLQEQLQNKGE